MKNHSKKLPKWTIVRRIVQFAVLLLFLTPFLAEIEGENFFFGTLSSSEILGIMLTDPFGALQIIFASKTVHTVLLIGAVTIFAFYFLIRGRVFCGWVCPVNLILEFCNRLRKLFKIKKRYDVKVNRYTKIWIALIILALSFASSLPVYEMFNPIGTVMKGIIFATGLGVWSFIAIVIAEVFFATRIWCRSLCPIGGFYQVVGKAGNFHVKIDHDKCIHCNHCKQVCLADSEILVPVVDQGAIYVTAGDCMLCGKCVDHCNDNALRIVPKLALVAKKENDMKKVEEKSA
ncbi:MAG TPA: quinol dehydrogenase ferredoxin subunit NapH [Firmicutes bacterium]|nr:quinol dehydrogenase ferredoxin subunit NapH [Bacillales bacterium]HJA41149.1 quinol dehydrogenase ferredoxin subunit NapH [Bacillota bacterium]